MNAKVQFQIVTTTVGARADARRLAGKLVASRLAACVQFFPIRSVYRWQGKVESAAEYVLTAKTRATLTATLIALIRRLHTYDTPEIVVTPILGGWPAYLDWIRAETKTRP